MSIEEMKGRVFSEVFTTRLALEAFPRNGGGGYRSNEDLGSLIRFGEVMLTEQTKRVEESQRANVGAQRSVVFVAEDDIFVLGHYQYCCESVRIEDVCGELEDLVGAPVVESEEYTKVGPQPGLILPRHADESCTYTFYKFRTEKGDVTIRFYGESNGYYSEVAECVKIERTREYDE